MTIEEARLMLQDNLGYLTAVHSPRISEAIKVAFEVLSELSNLEDAANSYAAKTECDVPACGGFKIVAQWMLNKVKQKQII